MPLKVPLYSILVLHSVFQLISLSSLSTLLGVRAVAERERETVKLTELSLCSCTIVKIMCFYHSLQHDRTPRGGWLPFVGRKRA